MKRAGQPGSRRPGPAAPTEGTRTGRSGLRRAFGPVLFGAATAFLVPFGCGVDHRPPGLSAGDTAVSSAASSGSAGAGGNGGAGGGAGVGAGPASACACATAAFTGDGSACGACLKKASAAGRECESQGIDCGADAACAPVVICLAACQKAPSASCVSDCLYPPSADDAHVKYLALLACACDACGGICSTADPVACTPTKDAGPGDAALDADDGGG